MIRKRIRPSHWLTIIMVCWSAVMIGQGFVRNYGGMMATRALLGWFEGGLFPGVAYFISGWYCRHERGFRMALFFCAATLAGAFGRLLARALLRCRAWEGSRPGAGSSFSRASQYSCLLYGNLGCSGLPKDVSTDVKHHSFFGSFSPRESHTYT
jgi:MFS family permease